MAAALPGLPRRFALARRVESLLDRMQTLLRERTAWQWRGAGGRLTAGQEKAVLCIGQDPMTASATREQLQAVGVDPHLAVRRCVQRQARADVALVLPVHHRVASLRRRPGRGCRLAVDPQIQPRRERAEQLDESRAQLVEGGGVAHLGHADRREGAPVGAAGGIGGVEPADVAVHAGEGLQVLLLGGRAPGRAGGRAG